MRIIRLLRRDDGAATAEYAITIMATVESLERLANR
jgi:hypothetical protein